MESVRSTKGITENPGSLELAIIEYTQLKFRVESVQLEDDLDDPRDTSETVSESSEIPSMSSGAGATPENYGVLFDLFLYVYFRRWLCLNVSGTITAFLEDIALYEDIKAPSSRLKWARAIVASVEAERQSTPYFAQFTEPADPKAVKDAEAFIYRYIQNPIKELMNTSMPINAYWTAISNVLSNWKKTNLNPSTTNGSNSTQLLPSGLLIPLFLFMIRGVMETYWKDFHKSKDYAAYESVVRLVRRQHASQMERMNKSFQEQQALQAQSGITLRSSIKDSTIQDGKDRTELDLLFNDLSRSEVCTDEFERLGVIGSGSYGSVYVWKEKSTGVHYAVKEMDKRLLKVKSSVHTVIRELACSLATTSPFVCGFEFSFTTPTSIFMGMPFMEHGDLERWLLAQPGKRFHENVCRFYICQVVISLKNLHQAGVIHRDIKASNILIDHYGNVSLTDHGLSVYAHRCSQLSPDYSRVCWGETPESTDACCLGCLQVAKLKEMQKLSEKCVTLGLSTHDAGLVAAESMKCALHSHSSSSQWKKKKKDVARLTTTPASSPKMSSPKASLLATPSSDGNPQENSQGQVPPLSVSSLGNPASANSNQSGAISSSVPHSAGSDGRKGSSFGLALRSFITGISRSESSGAGAAAATPPTGSAPGSAPSVAGSPLLRAERGSGAAAGNGAPSWRPGRTPSGGKSSAHCRPESRQSRQDEAASGSAAPGTPTTPTLAPQGTVSNSSNPQKSPWAMSACVPRTSSNSSGGVEAAAPAEGSRHSRNSRNSQTDPQQLDQDLADSIELGASGAPQAHTPSGVLVDRCVVNPVVLVASDCTCPVRQDDGRGWYKGRAGTSAYWCPQMISRDPGGERIAYGFDADWWSLGCLTSALLTGCSQFATGLGTSYDNAQTLLGAAAIHFPRGLQISKECKDFILSLSAVNPAKRLGSGPEGWRKVMQHPWFRGVDFGLVETRLLPNPPHPGYKIGTNWTSIPDKIESIRKNSQQNEAALAEAAAKVVAATTVLSPEDEAIFRACTYTSPDFFKRAWLRFAVSLSSSDLLKYERLLESGAKVSVVTNKSVTVYVDGQVVISRKRVQESAPVLSSSTTPAQAPAPADDNRASSPAPNHAGSSPGNSNRNSPFSSQAGISMGAGSRALSTPNSASGQKDKMDVENSPLRSGVPRPSSVNATYGKTNSGFPSRTSR